MSSRLYLGRNHEAKQAIQIACFALVAAYLKQLKTNFNTGIEFSTYSII